MNCKINSGKELCFSLIYSTLLDLPTIRLKLSSYPAEYSFPPTAEVTGHRGMMKCDALS